MSIAEITISLVKDLIAEQFPHWFRLRIQPVEVSGIDNKTFRLGSQMSIRLPNAEGYAPQVLKEQKWLPLLSPHLSFLIPKPLALGHPSKIYPWNWSIYQWIEGKSANMLAMEEIHLEQLALQLVQFLKDLHKIDPTNGPGPGPHNYGRGGPLSLYDTQARTAIAMLPDLIDKEKAIGVWEKAIRLKWDQHPVWIHGDFASGNILIKEARLAAVIDFGCMGVGDLACDLVIAWTYLKNKSRQIFQSQLNLDPGTWARAQGWALWKASLELGACKDKNSPFALKQIQIIIDLLDE